MRYPTPWGGCPVCKGVKVFEYERLEKLFRTLRYSAPATARQLSSVLGVSERTVRNDVSRLDAKLSRHGARIVTKWHEGYRIEVQDEDSFNAFLRQSQEDHGAPLLDTADERMRELLRILLLADEYLGASELASAVAVGESTVHGYLGQVRRLLETYGLECLSKRGVGVRVYGPEAARRRCYLERVILAPESSSSQITADERRLLPSLDVGNVLDIVRVNFARSGIGISDIELKRCALETSVALLRVRGGHLTEPVSLDQVAEPLRGLAHDICRDAEDAFACELPECEQSRIAYALAVSADKGIASVDLDDLNRDIDGILESILRDYGIDLRSDETLKENLVSHLGIIMKDRALQATKGNPMLNTIKQSFPLAFEAATTSLNQAVGTGLPHLTEEEIGYVALHIGAAMERGGVQARRRCRLALVCDDRPAAAQMLSARVASLFGSGIQIVWTGSLASYQLLGRDDLDEFDCVVSTVSLKDCPLPYVVVDFNLSSRDTQMLSRMLETLASRPQFDITALFSERYFSIESKANSKSELLKGMCDRLVEDGVSDGEMFSLVMERERFGKTNLSEDFAIPHPMLPCSNQTGVAVRILRGPLGWNSSNETVRIVFLLFIRPGDVENIEQLFNLLVRIADDAGLRRRILRVETFAEFRHVIAEVA